MSHSITLKSIGRVCGVSHITVSRALRGVGNVKPETVKRIQEYADSIGYKPNPIARSFARSCNGEFNLATTQSIIAPFNEDRVAQNNAPLYWDYIEGAVQAAVAKKSSIEVIGFSSSATEFDFIRTLVGEERVAGVLDFGLMEKTAAYLISQKIPLVSRLQSVHKISTRKNAIIYPDHIQGYLLSWQHIIDHGHRRVGYIGKKTHQEHLKECIAASHLLEDPLEIEKVIWLDEAATPESIQGALNSSLGAWKEGEWPTLFFCSNDNVAHQVVVSLSRMGLSVPQDVSVFGFDDSPAAQFCNPPISTLRNPRKEIGAAMFNLLKDIIAGHPNSRNRIEILPMQLVERDSVKKIERVPASSSPATH